MQQDRHLAPFVFYHRMSITVMLRSSLETCVAAAITPQRLSLNEQTA
jgi:hypothetical protein